ncbi:hypothetical protein XELAEV_18041365mg [Xenopus laevis]|uniref:Uncharacterized protein n=1 Tax=Xenopus laevis TaxID=8355 RepID=A0A974C2B5_XENLA|nr:hypothetical protein XELAEV_18041365mg [Xenopus laevis]
MQVSGQEQYCTLSNPRILPPLLWPDYLCVTYNCQYAALHKPEKLGEIPISRYTPANNSYICLTVNVPYNHHLILIKGVTDNEPVYSHFLPTKGRCEVTTLTLGIGSTVDYAMVSLVQDTHKKDHLCLLARFSLDLSTL